MMEMSVPYRENITSLLRAHQVNVIHRFVRTSQEALYLRYTPNRLIRSIGLFKSKFDSGGNQEEIEFW
jgi:hypothetical protein